MRKFSVFQPRFLGLAPTNLLITCALHGRIQSFSSSQTLNLSKSSKRALNGRFTFFKSLDRKNKDFFQQAMVFFGRGWAFFFLFYSNRIRVFEYSSVIFSVIGTTPSAPPSSLGPSDFFWGPMPLWPGSLACCCRWWGQPAGLYD